MKDTQNITIALLVVTTVILLAMLVSGTQEPAYADTPIKQGDYILGTGSWTDTTDVVYVIDIATRRLVVYYLDQNKNSLDIIDAVDLERAFTQ